MTTLPFQKNMVMNVINGEGGRTCRGEDGNERETERERELVRRRGVSVQREQMKASPVTRPAAPVQLTLDVAQQTDCWDATRTLAAVMDEVTAGALTRIRAAPEKAIRLRNFQAPGDKFDGSEC